MVLSVELSKVGFSVSTINAVASIVDVLGSVAFSFVDALPHKYIYFFLFFSDE